MRGLRFQPPAQVLDAAGALATTVLNHEQFGALAALRLHEARAAAALGLQEQARQAAQALVALLDEGYAPEFTYLPEAWLVAAEVFGDTGDEAESRRALNAGTSWVQARALPRVPPPFVDSFLQRNPVNRALLARAARSSPPESRR